MIIDRPSVNWNLSYQNPCKDRRELGCNVAPGAIPPEDRSLYLELLLRLTGTAKGGCGPQATAHGTA